MTVPLAQQIAEVRSEIDKRGSVYGRLVQKGQMRRGEADYKIETMKSVLATVKWLQANEAVVRDAVKAKSNSNGSEAR